MTKIRYSQGCVSETRKIKLTFLILLISASSYAQKTMSFGIHADPVISWFSTEIPEVKNDGARPGFNFGLTFCRYFAPNYAFTAGISLLNAGGSLVSSDTIVINHSNINSTVLPGKQILYKIQYLTFPVGLKLQSNQIGYVRFFTDVGFAPKIVVNRKLDIPSLGISAQDASNEVNMFNLSYHITAGIEYSLGGNTALVFGLDFDNNFMNITKNHGNQGTYKVSQKILSFRLGVNF